MKIKKHFQVHVRPNSPADKVRQVARRVFIASIVRAASTGIKAQQTLNDLEEDN